MELHALTQAAALEWHIVFVNIKISIPNPGLIAYSTEKRGGCVTKSHENMYFTLRAWDEVTLEYQVVFTYHATYVQRAPKYKQH